MKKLTERLQQLAGIKPLYENVPVFAKPDSSDSEHQENARKLSDILSDMSDEKLDAFLHGTRKSGHELMTKERTGSAADRMFIDFSSVTRWVLTLDNDIIISLLEFLDEIPEELKDDNEWMYDNLIKLSLNIWT